MANKRLQQTRDVVEYAAKYMKGKTLDLGAGSAKYRDIIEAKADTYTAFDMFPGERIDVVGNVLDLPFKNNHFDTVVSTQVLEHVERPWVMVEEIYRVLKEDGVCILTCPFITPYHADPGDYFRYTKEGARSLFKNAGFKIIECEYYGLFFTVTKEMIRFLFFSRFKQYKNKKPGVWAQRFVRYMHKFAAFLDNKIKNEQIIYNSVYIIVKK